MTQQCDADDVMEGVTGPAANRYDGWKAIADVLGCTVRTAQRRAQTLGLRIGRWPGTNRVFVLRSWLADAVRRSAPSRGCTQAHARENGRG